MVHLKFLSIRQIEKLKGTHEKENICTGYFGYHL